MKFGEVRRYSVKELLKDKPKQLDGLEPEMHEANNYTFDINKVTVFANRYELIYGDGYVIIAFYNRNTRVASLDAFCGDDFDEAFVVRMCGEIMSETSYRVMSSNMQE